MTLTGSTKNKSEAEIFEIVEKGDSDTFNIKTQNNKYLTFEGQSIKKIRDMRSMDFSSYIDKWNLYNRCYIIIINSKEYRFIFTWKNI